MHQEHIHTSYISDTRATHKTSTFSHCNQQRTQCHLHRIKKTHKTKIKAESLTELWTIFSPWKISMKTFIFLWVERKKLGDLRGVMLYRENTEAVEPVCSFCTFMNDLLPLSVSHEDSIFCIYLNLNWTCSCSFLFPMVKENKLRATCLTPPVSSPGTGSGPWSMSLVMPSGQAL